VERIVLNALADMRLRRRLVAPPAKIFLIIFRHGESSTGEAGPVLHYFTPFAC
jgi:hypothetical protein